jgi:proteasome lid subunit RPN8/RPN11
MAKKKLNKTAEAAAKSAEAAAEPAEQGLPQNVVLVGESAPSEKKVYISQKAYKTIRAFTKDKTKNESGGVLMGRKAEEFGKTHIVITGFVEAKHCEATPTTLTFTHESWEHIHKEADKRFPDCSIVGWIHTHPNFGIFLSEYDKFIQENFFNSEDQVAYVIDPIQKTEGFYIWLDGRIEKCAGFFVFDELDKKIELGQQEAPQAGEQNEPKARQGGSSWLLTGVMLILLAVMGITCWKLNSNVTALQARLDTLDQITAINLNTLYAKVAELEEANKALSELIEQPEADGTADPAAPAGDGSAQTTAPEVTGGQQVTEGG